MISPVDPLSAAYAADPPETGGVPIPTEVGEYRVVTDDGRTMRLVVYPVDDGSETYREWLLVGGPRGREYVADRTEYPELLADALWERGVVAIRPAASSLDERLRLAMLQWILRHRCDDYDMDDPPVEVTGWETDGDGRPQVRMGVRTRGGEEYEEVAGMGFDRLVRELMGMEA